MPNRSRLWRSVSLALPRQGVQRYETDPTPGYRDRDAKARDLTIRRAS